jgi:hypothetical protein
MFRSPGGIIRREARWLVAILIVPAILGFLATLVIPWIARRFR